MSRRLEAYFLDWMISIAAGVALCLLAAALLLLSSNLDRRDPPGWSLYAAILIVSLWLPIWLLYTSLTWAWFGATAGMALAGVHVISRAGTPPGPWRAAARGLVLALFTAPVLVSPLLIAAAVSLGTAGPAPFVAPVVVLVLISAAACASPLLSPAGEAWHDRLTATRVVRL